MDQHALERIRHAVHTAAGAARGAGLDNCDLGDLGDAIEAVRQQLSQAHPSPIILTLYLNSIGRSLLGKPSAREALDDIDAALRQAALPAAWGSQRRRSSFPRQTRT
ncbi:MAG TPA: hypothetical protein VFN79_09555 [Steroidobacteraceae bacterium]|nr:hypothetical protein [Steroidobacteraceae bacterium]